MKNAVEYYYNIPIDEIRKANNKYRFNFENYTYILYPFENSIDIKIHIKLSNYLLERGVYCHQFMYNINRDIITVIDGISYVLFRCFVNIDQKIELNDLQQFSLLELNLKEFKPLIKTDWHTMWSSKIDYFEYQITQFGKKFPIVRESLSYYIGLTENAISILSNVNIEKINLMISKKRFLNKDDYFNFFNPLEMIIDTKSRNAAEYFKNKFFYENINIKEEITRYIEFNLNDGEKLLFFIRMIFPSYYFDLYQDIILENVEEKEILNILNKVNEYEELLKYIYSIILIKYPYLDIFWLKKAVN